MYYGSPSLRQDSASPRALGLTTLERARNLSGKPGWPGIRHGRPPSKRQSDQTVPSFSWLRRRPAAGSRACSDQVTPPRRTVCSRKKNSLRLPDHLCASAWSPTKVKSIRKWLGLSLTAASKTLPSACLPRMGKQGFPERGGAPLRVYVREGETGDPEGGAGKAAWWRR